MVNHPRRSKAATTSRLAKTTRRTAEHEHDHDLDYSALLIGARKSFETHVRGQTKLFTTDAEGLWEAYLAALPAGKERQIHNCHCCRRFVRTYGGLVAIAATGEQWPVMWSAAGVPEFYDKAFSTLWARVMGARVTGVFLTKETTWGTPETSGKGEYWQHLSVVPSAEFVYRPGQALEPHQAMAAAKENVTTVLYAMSEYGPKVLDEAIRIFEAEALDRSEKFLGPVRWLRALHEWPKGRQNEPLRNNLIWRAVAHAPEGFCHIKSSIIGPLLDDIVAGVPFADIKRKHADKLHPLKYQRPQAAPSAGNIRAAEQLVEKMGIAPSLERRFARIDELPLEDAFWTEPDPVRDAGTVARTGVFSHLLAKQQPRDHVKAVDLPQVTMTWEKFKRTVLIDAKQIEILVPNVGAFTAFTTAVHADAPPIMKWDREEERNPVCWYHYHGGSPASQWRLTNGTYARVLAILAFPGMWGSRPMPHLFTGAVLVIEGCADTRTGQGNALFPETLRDDLHAVRSTIESYSKSATLSGREAASACGITMGPGSNPLQLRALIKGAWNRYVIDRLD